MWCVRWGCGCQPWFHATSTERRNILTAFMDVRAVITLRDVVTRSSSPVWTGREVKGRTGAGSWRQTRNHPGILMQVAGNFCRLSSVCSCICHCTGLINCHTDVTLGLTHSVIAHHWGESMHALVRGIRAMNISTAWFCLQSPIHHDETNCVISHPIFQ